MARAFVSVGSNIEPEIHVRQALALIAVRTHLAAISTVYLTDPLGRPEQDPYYNCVLEIATDLPPLEVKRTLLQAIENKLGRVRRQDKYAPRTIDLDLIVYGDLILDEDGLKLPDPEIMKRPFLALPLAELAPGWVLAGSNRRIEEVAAALSADRMRPLADYARQLRQELLP
ncbi:MAG TPA: 2-amino-4-hydroxy-6-hydroxymethyldihydropteridine diphosphokinase [Gallionellaceae bacterium]|nr:2-amino-4-hydroxy-6-hydroxymethyldihydropteridine diphosphokinase [Gallionellaceae bacterium]